MNQAATPKMNSGHSINKDLMAAQAMSSGASHHYHSAKIGSQQQNSGGPSTQAFGEKDRAAAHSTNNNQFDH